MRPEGDRAGSLILINLGFVRKEIDRSTEYLEMIVYIKNRSKPGPFPPIHTFETGLS